ncbi:MAG: hypothetical protein AB3N17_10290 [Tateyamaria sp.]
MSLAQAVFHGGRTGGMLGAYGGPWGAAAGAVVGGLLAGGAYWLGSEAVSQMSQANSDAESLGNTDADVRCATCDQNPCAHLANGVPGSPYRGGAHGAMRLPVGDGLDSHHTPARAASYLHPEVGPSIQMDPADHALTASNGRMPGSAQYIAAQRHSVNSGNFLAAQAMDIADIRAKFGSKYDAAIAQMEAYSLCLRRNGIIR